MAAKDFDRFAQLHVIASVQPYHAIDDGRWAEGRIGHDRASRTYAFRTFLDHSVRLALGTDWNVAPLNPMLTLYAAVTNFWRRCELKGRERSRNGGTAPEEDSFGCACRAPSSDYPACAAHVWPFNAVSRCAVSARLAAVASERKGH